MLRTLIALALTTTVFAADEPIPGVAIDGLGRLRVGPIGIQWIHFAKEWRLVDQGAVRADKGLPTTTDGLWKLTGTWPTQAGGDFAVEQTVRATDPHRLAYSLGVKHPTGLETNALALSVSLPSELYAGRTLWFGEKAIVLPLEIAKGGLFAGRVPLVRIPAENGALAFSGSLDCYVQDDRNFGGKSFSIRLGLGTGLVKDASLAVDIGLTPYATHPLDLRSAANVAWADETADDQRGGWTDQGPANDLSAIRPGVQRLANVPFTLLDPAQNSGRSAIVLAGAQRAHFPKSATVRIPDASDRHLYLLHGSAWTPASGTVVGRLRVKYQDGDEGVIDVTAGTDVANWWAPHGLKNGVVAWTADNRSAYVGLFCSRFALTKAAESVQLESAGTGVWMVAAITASPDAIPLPTEGPFYIIAGDGWRPVTSGIDVEAGSILDFSTLLDAPAGKHGPVVVKDDHFIAGTKRLRFYGTNFCFGANFPSHAESEAIAMRMAREGYNSVRLHHYDWDLTAKDDKTDSTVIDPAQRDRFDYLIHCLEQRGIYISIDLYTFRRSLAHEIPEVGGELRGGGYKAAVILLDSAMANWQRFARNVLLPVNPYTGRSLAEDPALVGVCPVNEDTITAAVGDDAKVQAIARTLFETWLATRAEPQATPADRDRLWVRFLSERQIDANRRITAFLRGLGLRAPITGVNFISAMNLVPTRADVSFDFVDNHSYWDHPGFPERPWSLPHSYNNRSATTAGAAVPRDLLPARIIGKPYTITEFNYTFPNRFRAEGGPLMGAYAALQDWDGLWRFAHAHSLQNLVSARHAGGFDLGTDPLSRLSERLGMLCFLRGDVAPAKGRIALVVDETTAWAGHAGWGGSNFPDGFGWLGLHTRIGSVWGMASAPGDPVVLAPVTATTPGVSRLLVPETDLPAQLVREGAIPAGAVDVAAKAVTSDTGELRLAGNAGRFQVVTDRCEQAVLVGPGEAVGRLVTITNTDLPATVGVAAMDGKTLADTARVLVLHLTDLQNTRQRYRGQAMTLLDAWGDLPHLVRAGNATVKLRLAGEWTAWACDLAGHRVREIPLRRDGDALVLTSDQNTGPEPVLVYDLQRR